MADEKLQNLYEVTKTVRFELKPSQETLSRTIFDNKFEIKDDFEQNIQIKDLFNNLDLDKAKTTEKFIRKLLEEIETEILNKADMIISNIKNNQRYEVYKIYLNTSNIRNVNKDFRDCLHKMKGKMWGYKSGKEKNEIKIKFKESMTWTQLNYFNRKNGIGEFNKLFLERFEELKTRFYYLELGINGFLTNPYQHEMFVSKPEKIDRIKRLCWLAKDIKTLTSLFDDFGGNGSLGCPIFIRDLKALRNFETERWETIENIIGQINYITNPQANYHKKYTLNLKTINPNIQSVESTSVKKEGNLEDQLFELETEREEKRKEESRLKGYNNRFFTLVKGLKLDDKLTNKNLVEKVSQKFEGYKTMWNLEKNKQGLEPKFELVFYNYQENIVQLESIKSEISNNKNPDNLYARINRTKADLRNAKITHFAKIVRFEGTYILALEDKLKTKDSIKKPNEFELQKLVGTGAKYLEYESLTWKAVEKLCLLQTSSCRHDKKEEIVNLWQEMRIDKEVRDNPKNINRIKKYLSEAISINNLSENFDEEEFAELNDLAKIRNYFDEVCYKCTWENCNFEQLKNLDKQGKVDLYQIYNKDFTIYNHFALTESDKFKLERQKETKKDDKFKSNLHTIYWKNFFENLGFDSSRLQTEGKIYIRPTIDQSIKAGQRFAENKIFGDFLLKFNPVKSENEYKNIVRETQKSKNPKERISIFNEYLENTVSAGEENKEIYVIGLDRGENSLVSYVLCRFVKKIIEQNDVKVRFSDKLGTEGWVLNEIVEAQDLSAVKVFNQKGGWKKNEFVEQIEQFRIAKDLPDFENVKNSVISLIAQKHPDYSGIDNPDSWLITEDCELRTEEEKRSKHYIFGCLKWQDETVSIFNYAVDFAHKAYQKKLEKQKWNQANKHQIIFEPVKYAKKGYVSAFIDKICSVAIEKNATIVFEDLHKLMVLKELNQSYTESQVEKTLGTTPYQFLILDLQRKLSWYGNKNNESNFQLSPKIQRTEETKSPYGYNENFLLKQHQQKNTENIPILKPFNNGKIAFVDEFLTSRSCPCENCSSEGNRKKWDDKDNKWNNKVALRTDVFKCKNNKCNFNTGQPENSSSLFKKLTNADIVAAFNIAKRYVEK